MGQKRAPDLAITIWPKKEYEVKEQGQTTVYKAQQTKVSLPTLHISLSPLY
jgi:arginine decarboxylase-like protein